jgi:hypothetical protein
MGDFGAGAMGLGDGNFSEERFDESTAVFGGGVGISEAMGDDGGGDGLDIFWQDHFAAFDEGP